MGNQSSIKNVKFSFTCDPNLIQSLGVGYLSHRRIYVNTKRKTICPKVRPSLTAKDQQGEQWSPKATFT